jgi:myo-inositol-1-phosphate synthase
MAAARTLAHGTVNGSTIPSSTMPVSPGAGGSRSGGVGVWLIGAKGGVATTLMTGLAALQRQALPPIGLVTALEPFSRIDLAGFDQLVIGGHDIRTGPLGGEAGRMWSDSRAIDPDLIAAAAGFLDEVEERLRPGTVVASGERIRSLADAPGAVVAESPREAIARVQADIADFAARERLRHVVVVNVASTEPPPERPIPASFADLEPLLDDPAACPLPASSLYFLGAAAAGASYVNFTPSTGATPPALQAVARDRGVAHAGCDGKTGETLLKSVLGPMFAARHLEVMSWVGHNIFGNMDGKVLDDPRNKAAKVRSKDHLLSAILGYQPQTHVSIEYIASLGDWKTAWDHVHFRGFLGTPMTLQFTWQGCDSILAAPLVLDLVRLVERAHRAGATGVLPWTACFFKSPLGTHEQDFGRQVAMLHAWAESLEGQGRDRRERKEA